MEKPMTAAKAYRVCDNRTGTVTEVPASYVPAYERALWDEADRQAYRSAPRTT